MALSILVVDDNILYFEGDYDGPNGNQITRYHS